MDQPTARLRRGLRWIETNYEGIYCHFDGYESGVGAILLEHYSDPAKVAALIALGDISSLGERVAPIGPHSFEEREEGTTTAYHRDRSNEPWSQVKPKTGRTVQAVADKIGHDGYVYVFDGHEWQLNGRKLTAKMVETGA